MILRNLWSWIGECVRERDCRVTRVSMASFLSVCSPVEFIAGRFVLLRRRKKKMFVITLAPPQRRKLVFAPVCAAGRNAHPELPHG
jgi:hypothetical protein